jgi:hypothetical protein
MQISKQHQQWKLGEKNVKAPSTIEVGKKTSL